MNLLNSTRLRSVRRVRLFSLYQPDEEEAEAVFTAILEHEGIRQLNISQNQMNKVNPDTLAKAVNSMEQANLHNAAHAQHGSRQHLQRAPSHGCPGSRQAADCE